MNHLHRVPFQLIRQKEYRNQDCVTIFSFLVFKFELSPEDKATRMVADHPLLVVTAIGINMHLQPIIDPEITQYKMNHLSTLLR